jgi:hypothetical protein
MAYSPFRPGKPTQSHVDSLERNLGAPFQACSFPDMDVPFSVPDLDLSLIRPLLLQTGSPSVKSPIGCPPRDSVPQNLSFSGELAFFQGMTNTAFLLRYKDFYGPQIAGLPRNFRSQAPATPLYGGKLVPLDKDGGWKIRWIASPYRVHQEALSPLGSTLFNLLRTIPWDCTFDQQKAVPVLQKLLQSGKMIHSVDLESATDHFPLDLQLQVLGRLNTSSNWRKSLSLFRDLSRSAWYYKGHDYYWKKGQPMGLYPSFPAFALTHGILLRTLAEGKSPFFVLGDDVVIWDDTLYNRYREFLDRYSIPVSEKKCLNSSTCCEFAGAVITSSKVYRGYKWKSYDDENFLDLMRNFGKRFLPALSYRQRRVYSLVKSWQPPLGCNHEVSDLVRSVIETPDPNPEHWRHSVTSFLQWMQSRSDLAELYSLSALRAAQDVFDEKMSCALNKIGFPAWTKYPGGLSSVLACQKTDLPHIILRGNRQSTLEWYEDFLSPLGKKYTPSELQLLGCLHIVAKQERALR